MSMGITELARKNQVHERGRRAEGVIGHQGSSPVLSVEEVRERILQACRTLRALPDQERKFQTLANSWPDFIREISEAYGYDEERLPKFRPSPADVSDCLIALQWARAIPKRDFKLIWWRSFDISFRHMGLRLGRTDETARLRFRDAILNVWMEANRLLKVRS